jgi:hypothetical protein
MRKLGRGSMVRLTQEQVSCDLGGEVAILHLKTGMYYGMDEVGARIWSLLGTPMTIGSILETLLTEYEIEPDLCEQDLLGLLHTLQEEGLVQVDDSPAA